jgi:glycosyltransferase involved in cell wall biosynthesis
MPELTVTMLASNAAAHIGEAVASVLRQEGVDFELIVVDDGSQDETVEIARRFHDPRLRLFRNEARRGAGFSHNLVVAASRAPFVVHVPGDHVIFKADAFAKLLGAIRNSESVGEAHGYVLRTDADGRIPWDRFRTTWKDLVGSAEASRDYRRDLLVHGSVAHHLRMYRKAALKRVGPFDERLASDAEFDMVLRIADRYETVRVPEFLCAVREQARGASCSRFCTGIRDWWRRHTLCSRLVKTGAIRFPLLPEYRKNRLMLLGLARVLWLDRGWSKLPAPQTGLLRAMGALRSAILATSYRVVVRCLGWWPIGLWTRPARQRAGRSERLALCLCRLPAPDETSVCREIEALQSDGLSALVVTEEDDHSDWADSAALESRSQSSLVLRLDPERYASYRQRFFRERPLRFLNLLCYVLLHADHPCQKFQERLDLFRKAICLAGALEETGATHVHALSAGGCPPIAAVAARLMAVGYSVQPHACETHPERSEKRGAPEALVRASFVVTRSRSQADLVRALLGARKPAIHMIYTGVDPTRICPLPRRHRDARPTILSVARFTERDGLAVLLEACKLLRDRGCSFQCRIIGEPELPAHMNAYVTIMRLYEKFALEDCVSFLGRPPFSRVLQCYNAADVFVLPGSDRNTGSPGTIPDALIEAMAMELAVVSTSAPAIREIVVDGVTGLLVPAENPSALAGAVGRLFEDGILRRRLGKRAREKVERQFDITRNIGRLRNLCCISSAHSCLPPSRSSFLGAFLRRRRPDTGEHSMKPQGLSL